MGALLFGVAWAWFFSKVEFENGIVHPDKNLLEGKMKNSRQGRV
jgi:hypothetical protein